MTKPEKIDVDAIICAHWKILCHDNPGRKVVIATSNFRHLDKFAEAFDWPIINF